MNQPEPDPPAAPILSPARDPVVWTFIVLLAATMFFAIMGAYQNYRIGNDIRAAQRYNQEQLDYLRGAIQKREADLKIEAEAKRRGAP